MQRDHSFLVLQAGNAILQQCQALVDQLALFSSNEEAEDLATAGEFMLAGMLSVLPLLASNGITMVRLLCRYKVHADTSYAW